MTWRTTSKPKDVLLAPKQITAHLMQTQSNHDAVVLKTACVGLMAANASRAPHEDATIAGPLLRDDRLDEECRVRPCVPPCPSPAQKLPILADKSANEEQMQDGTLFSETGTAASSGPNFRSPRPCSGFQRLSVLSPVELVVTYRSQGPSPARCRNRAQPLRGGWDQRSSTSTEPLPAQFLESNLDLRAGAVVPGFMRYWLILSNRKRMATNSLSVATAETPSTKGIEMQEQAHYAIGWGTLSLIDAGLAQSKGRSGLLWWLFSLFLDPWLPSSSSFCPRSDLLWSSEKKKGSGCLPRDSQRGVMSFWIFRPLG